MPEDASIDLSECSQLQSEEILALESIFPDKLCLVHDHDDEHEHEHEEVVEDVLSRIDVKGKGKGKWDVNGDGNYRLGNGTLGEERETEIILTIEIQFEDDREFTIQEEVLQAIEEGQSREHNNGLEGFNEVPNGGKKTTAKANGGVGLTTTEGTKPSTNGNATSTARRGTGKGRNAVFEARGIERGGGKKGRDSGANGHGDVGTGNRGKNVDDSQSEDRIGSKPPYARNGREKGRRGRGRAHEGLGSTENGIQRGTTRKGSPGGHNTSNSSPTSIPNATLPLPPSSFSQHPPIPSSSNKLNTKTISSTITTTLSLSHLPSLQLHFLLPLSYPLESPPQLSTVEWIVPGSQSRKAWKNGNRHGNLGGFGDDEKETEEGKPVLTAQGINWEKVGKEIIDATWQPGDQILFTLCDDLSSRIPDLLPSKTTLLSLTSSSSSSSSPSPSLEPYPRSLNLNSSPEPNHPKSKSIPRPNNFHPRHHLLKTYDLSQKSKMFQLESFNCGICLEERKGVGCFKLDGCGHVFCLDCLISYFTLLIQEGAISQLQCPEPTCVTERVKWNRTRHDVTNNNNNNSSNEEGNVCSERADKIPGQVKDEEVRILVGEELMERFAWLRDKQRAESDPTISYCPQPLCEAPVERDPSSSYEKLRICERCGFSFCVFCRRTWHGSNNPCEVPKGLGVVEKYLSSSPEEQSKLEKRYGASVVKRLVEAHLEDKANAELIKQLCTNCPGCGVSIEKSSGCNHVICRKCNQHFCFRCGTRLKATDPYMHFQQRGSCYQKLFDVLPSEQANEDALWEEQFRELL